MCSKFALLLIISRYAIVNNFKASWAAMKGADRVDASESRLFHILCINNENKPKINSAWFQNQFALCSHDDDMYFYFHTVDIGYGL